MPLSLLWLLLPAFWFVRTFFAQRSRTARVFLGALLSLFAAQAHAQTNSAPQVIATPVAISLDAPGRTQPLGITYRDAQGSGTLRSCWLVINTSATWSYAVCAVYDAPTNLIYLRNISGTAWSQGAAPGSSAVLSNDMGSIDCALTTAERSGTDITIKWSVTAGSPLGGTNHVYGYAQDSGNLNSGPAGTIGIYSDIGTWTISDSGPTATTYPPLALSTTTGQAQTVTSTLSDADGWNNVRYVSLEVNEVNNWKNSFYLVCDAYSHTVKLRSDDGGSWSAPVTLGSSTHLANSQGSLDCSQTTISGSGNDLRVNWRITMKEGSLGTKNLYVNGADRANVSTPGPFVQVGTWTVSRASAPVITLENASTLRDGRDYRAFDAERNAPSATFTFSSARVAQAGLDYPRLFMVSGIQNTSLHDVGNLEVGWISDAPILEIPLYAFHGALKLTVDGTQWIDAHQGQTSAPFRMPANDGALKTIRIDWTQAGGRQMRHYKAQVESFFAGVRVGRGDTVSPQSPPRRLRVAFVGDSYVEGAGANSVLDGFAAICARTLNCEPILLGSGRTGYVATPYPGRAPFGGRLDDLRKLSPHPDVIVVAGGINDTVIDEAFSSAVSSYFSDLQSFFPSTRVVVFGPWNPLNRSDGIQADLIKALAQGYDFAFVDVRDWLPAANQPAYVGPDRVHPSALGHEYLGAKTASALKPLLPPQKAF